MFKPEMVASLRNAIDEAVSASVQGVKLLALRERAMIICDALTGIRRGELMGLQWQDVDFLGRRINIVRSEVDQAINDCKTEASR